MEGKIFDIMRYSIHDGPGIRTTVFLKGCPLNCWWCHNPESQEVNEELMLFPNRCINCMACIKLCKQNAIEERNGMIFTSMDKCTDCGSCVEKCYAEARKMAGETMTVDQVVEEILKDRDFYQQSKGGVTFSGGEPLMQFSFLNLLLKKMKEYGIHTTIDTSGFASKEIIEEISKNTDLFLYDLKHIDPEKHEKYTGVLNHKILENLKNLSDIGKDIIVRIPIIPGINNSEEDLKDFRDFIKTLYNIKEVNLLPYHKIGQEKYNRLGKPYKILGVEEPDLEMMNFASKIIGDSGVKVNIGG